MATLLTHSEAKDLLTDNLVWLKDAKYPRDEVVSMSRSSLPIYTADIIAVWATLPSEYSNKFSEIRSAGEWLDFTIEELMTDDLVLYYDFVFDGAFAELADELGFDLENY